MALYLGIDTSNYTTSVALYNNCSGKIVQQKKLLPVKSGDLGLKQSDAVFLHTKQLGELIEEILLQAAEPVEAVAASISPRDEAGSYMPCFLVGKLVGRSVSAALKVPFYDTSHQAGHIAAALYSAGQLPLMQEPFLAFHFSGGTTQCLLVEPDDTRVFQITTVAQTLDLNAGQAVDRVGAGLGLEFPAGPMLEQLAMQSEKHYAPKPALKGADCCLSGLENQCAKRQEAGELHADVARYCLDYLIQTILQMTKRVRQAYPALPLIYAGGVMSNAIIKAAVQKEFNAGFAAPEFSCDNAAGAAILCCARNGGVLQC